MKFSRNEHIFWITCVVIILAVTGLLYYDFRRQLDVDKGRVVGSLVELQKTAQRKYEAQVVWEDLDRPEKKTIPLYNRDAIRTSELAMARIRLNDGTEILLGANSMIILNISEDSMNIDYAYGSLQTRRTGKAEKAGTKILKIKTRDNKSISVVGGDVKLTQATDKKISVSVNRGEAKVTGAGGEEQEVKKDQIAVLTEEKVEIRPLNLKPLSPPDNKRLFIREKSTAVLFRWEKTEGAGPATLELAHNPTFNEGVIRRESRNSRTNLSLAPGTYYWRIRAHNPKNRKIEYSTANRLIISGNSTVFLSGPRDGSRIEYAGSEPLVNFSWNTNEFASSYILEISADRQFSRPRTLTSRANTVSRTLPAGHYFARVRTTSGFPDATITGPAISFTIVKKTRLSPPELIQPGSGKSISSVIIEKQGVIFNWNQNEALRRSEILIARSTGFTGAERHLVNGNFFTLKKNLPAGEYFWKVRGLDADGNPRTEYSKIFNFRAIKKFTIRSLTPSPGEEFDLPNARFPGLHFSWDRVGSFASYRLEISSNPDFAGKQPVPPKKTRKNTAGVPINQPGKYFWRVVLLDDQGNEIARTERRTFIIRDILPAPQVTFPQSNTVVDMTYRNALPFNWNQTPGANLYRLNLYQIKGERRRKIFEATTRDTAYLLKDLSKLDEGHFAWTLQALQYRGKKEIASKKIIHRFKIHLRGAQGPIIKPAEIFID